MKSNDFTAFILTHGRPDNVITYETLRKSGYTGRIVILIDNEDKTAEKYHENFPNEVEVFDKLAMSKKFDQADNFDDRRAIVYARNASFKIAKKLGIKYFIQLDDDYTNFRYRFNDKLEYKYRRVLNLDTVFSNILNFYINTKSLKSIALAQGGDFLGGTFAKKIFLSRKCMNSFICSTERPFQFQGRINEDVNTYTQKASLGSLFFTINFNSLNQKMTQSNQGGMTDIYLDNGTYIKSFYSIIFQPSSVKIGLMGNLNMRLHHSVNWKYTTPKILREEIKK